MLQSGERVRRELEDKVSGGARLRQGHVSAMKHCPLEYGHAHPPCPPAGVDGCTPARETAVPARRDAGVRTRLSASLAHAVPADQQGCALAGVLPRAPAVQAPRDGGAPAGEATTRRRRARPPRWSGHRPGS